MAIYKAHSVFIREAGLTKQQQQVQPPDQPPDPTVDQNPNAAAGDPNADPNAAGEDPNADPNAAAGDPNADPNAAGGDPNATAPSTNEREELDQSEQQVLSNLKPEQVAIMKKELKEQYQKLYTITAESLDKLNKISPTTYDNAMLDFINKKFLMLKSLIRDSLVYTFVTRTYQENKIELQRFYNIFLNLTKLLDIILESRLKRQKRMKEMTDKQNKKLFNRKPEFPFIFSRGYDVQ